MIIGVDPHKLSATVEVVDQHVLRNGNDVRAWAIVRSLDNCLVDP